MSAYVELKIVFKLHIHFGLQQKLTLIPSSLKKENIEDRCDKAYPSNVSILSRNLVLQANCCSLSGIVEYTSELSLSPDFSLPLP